MPDGTGHGQPEPGQLYCPTCRTNLFSSLFHDSQKRHSCPTCSTTLTSPPQAHETQPDPPDHQH